jgi:hypothetical protein
MERFGREFLTWTFGQDEKTIVHCVAVRGNLETLQYVLGFFSTIENLKDKNGRTPYDSYYRDKMPAINFQTLTGYQKQPKMHPQDVLKLANKPAANKTGVTSFLSDIFDKKVLGLLGTFVLLGLLYRYSENKDKDRSAAE